MFLLINLSTIYIPQPFSEKLYDVGKKLELNRQWSLSAYRPNESGNHLYMVDRYGNTLPSNYGHGFDVPFYIGLKHNINDEPEKNQWKWSSTERMISKETLGIRGRWEEQTDQMTATHKARLLKYWKLISWAKNANGKKLRGDCVFVTIEAELWEIKCSTKLTIICEESFS